MPLFTPELEFSDDYPTIEPSLKLDFANARALDPRITFTRASTATYVGRDGLIKYAGDDEARFDHDPATGESLGLLIEESRTNILKGTSNFTSGYWTIGGTRSTQGSNQLAPDGTLSAFSNAYNGTSGDANIYYSDAGNNAGGEAPTANSTVYTLSVFAKVPSGNNYIQGIYVRTFNPNNSAIFNLKTGTIIGTNEGTTTNRMEAYPNGWYRCSITFTSGTDGNQGVQFYLTNSSNGTALNDPSANGEALYYWAPQLEAGSFPTSYVPTSGAAAARAADNASITGESFSNFYNSTEGTFFAEADTINPRYNDAITDYDGGNNNYSIMGTGDSPNRFQLRFDDQEPFQSLTFGPNSTTALAVNVNLTPTLDVKIAGTIKQNDARAYAKGVSILTDTSIDLINPVALYIGNLSGSSEYLNGHIKKLSYYPKALPNTQLQTLTQ